MLIAEVGKFSEPLHPGWLRRAGRDLVGTGVGSRAGSMSPKVKFDGVGEEALQGHAAARGEGLRATKGRVGQFDGSLHGPILPYLRLERLACRVTCFGASQRTATMW